MSTRFARIAVLWFLCGVLLGAWMGATHQTMDRSLHAHINLLGWVSCALFALLHRAWPALSGGRLGVAHFWLHNAGLLSITAGLALLPRGQAAAGPLLGAGSVMLVVATAAFAGALWRCTRTAHDDRIATAAHTS